MNDEKELPAEAEATDEEPKQKSTPRQSPRQRAASTNDPLSYRGGRRVLRTTTCGWCSDEIHENCKHETAHFDRLWVCNCECNASWEPQNLGSGEIIDIIIESDSEDTEDPARPEKPAAPVKVRRKTGR